MTVAELCAAYFKDADAGHVLGKGGHPKKASTLKTDKSRVASHVIPLIGARTVISLTRADIEKLQRDITDGRARRARGPGRGGQVTGGHGAASRTLGCFGAILAWAVRQGIITASPAVGVRRHADGQRERVLGVDELAALAAAIAASDAHHVGLAAIRLALLTGFRKSEVLTLLWVWVDLAAQCIRLGSHKTMTMTPGAGAQVRPVGYAACELLRAQPRYPGCPYVFPATRAGVAGHFVGAPKLLATLCERAGIDGVTLHTLRHTFASVAAELGYSELVIAALLGHRGGSVTRRYVHLPDPLLVSAADAVSARIATLCRG